jgi:WD40 repeat protein
VAALAFSPDGKYLATAGNDAISRISALADGREAQRFGRLFGLEAVRYSPDGARIAWTHLRGTSVHDVDIAGAGEARRFKLGADIKALTFRPDGSALAAVARDGTGRIWNLESGHELVVDGIDSRAVSGLRFSPDGHSLIVSDSFGPQIRMPQDTSTPPPLVSPEFTAIGISRNGHYRAMAYGDGVISVEQIADSLHIAQLQMPGHTIKSIFIGPDGKHLVTASNERVIQLWDSARKVELSRIVATTGAEGAKDYVRAAFLDDAVHVVMAGLYELSIWNATSKQMIVRVPRAAKIRAIAMSPEDDYIALGNDDGTAEVWEMGSGRRLSEMQRHENDIAALAFDPTSRFLATSSGPGQRDRTLRIWEVDSGREIVRVTHDKGVGAVGFSPDGRYVASGSGDGLVRLWYWLPQDLIDEACARLTRNLHTFEWENYLPAEEKYRQTCQNVKP